MTPEQLCGWLQTYIDLNESKALDMNMVRVIKERLKLVEKTLKNKKITVKTPKDVIYSDGYCRIYKD